MKYKLTVVTTTYNQEKYIEHCIKGVISQKTNFKFKFLIADDCSSDNTKSIIEKYRKKYPDIIKPIYRKKNLGPMDNFVNTLNLVNTEYVALCDGDDFWTDPNKLQIQVDFLDKNKEYTICFHKIKIFYEDGSQKNVFHPINLKKNLNFKDLCGENFMPANSIVYRWIYKKKDSLINDFPKNILPGDYYVNLMHAYRGKIYYIPKQMSCYRKNDQGMWWGINEPELQIDFYFKNGFKMLNFYDEVEKKLDVDKECFSWQRMKVLYGLLRSCMKLKKYKELKEVYSKYYKDNSYAFAAFYGDLNVINKIIYLIKTDIFYRFR